MAKQRLKVPNAANDPARGANQTTRTPDRRGKEPLFIRSLTAMGAGEDHLRSRIRVVTEP
ncbi:hypothetical protein [Streptomyces sp. TP-A0874]|uniref:hypothetical protein n=1 Tax=Streptomyces sp. TP-A0874 TaxID=549819 RepID=UPI000852BF20|nr:hypothetical protein [Streptomyces sp. TP-A0874]